jgi:hypothetical protein
MLFIWLSDLYGVRNYYLSAEEEGFSSGFPDYLVSNTHGGRKEIHRSIVIPT